MDPGHGGEGNETEATLALVGGPDQWAKAGRVDEVNLGHVEDEWSSRRYLGEVSPKVGAASRVDLPGR